MKEAPVRLACGECGRSLTGEERRCPSCGASLVYPGTLASTAFICPSCGQSNPPGAAICASCGTRLRSEGKGSRAPRRKEKKPAAKRERGLEPWMLVAGLSLLVLVAYVGYDAVTSPPASQPAAGPPVQSPATVAPMVDLRPLEEAVQRDPGNPAPLLRLANGLHDSHEFARAIATYERYLKMVPGNPDARVDMGICYFELAQQSPERAKEYFERALSAMEDALKRSPTHQPAAFNLGIVNLQMGNVQASNTWFKRTVELGKDTPLGQRAQKTLDQHTNLQ